MNAKAVMCPPEMLEVIEKVIQEAEKKQGLKISIVQAQQIIAKGYQTKN